METSTQIIIHSLAASQRMLARFTQDLSAEEYLHRPTAKANCAAWILGHLILTERRLLGRLGQTNLPPLPDGFESRFGRDESAAMSAEFGDTAVLLPLFNQHRDLVIETVKSTPADKLGAPLESPSPQFKTLGEAANFMAIHVSMHAGQITTIRRSLGRPPLS